MDGPEPDASPTESGRERRRSTLGERMMDEEIGMTVHTPIQCHACVHLTSKAKGTCRAFPGGIPASILLDRFDHTRPYPGDNGIRFERKRGA